MPLFEQTLAGTIYVRGRTLYYKHDEIVRLFGAVDTADSITVGNIRFVPAEAIPGTGLRTIGEFALRHGESAAEIACLRAEIAELTRAGEMAAAANQVLGVENARLQAVGLELADDNARLKVSLQMYSLLE